MTTNSRWPRSRKRDFHVERDAYMRSVREDMRREKEEEEKRKKERS